MPAVSTAKAHSGFCQRESFQGRERFYELFDCSLKEEQIVEKIPLGKEIIPLQSPELWCNYYRLMGRTEKVKMIEHSLSG